MHLCQNPRITLCPSAFSPLCMFDVQVSPELPGLKRVPLGINMTVGPELA